MAVDIPGFPTLSSGFKKGRGIKFNAESNLYELATALAASTTKLNKSAVATTTRAGRYLVSHARNYFEADVKRPSESGFGAGGRRLTGKFTFGGDGGAFRAVTDQISDTEFTIGFPDIETADNRTKYKPTGSPVWRSLEFGLAPTGPSFLEFAELSQFFPRGSHILPRRFFFTAPLGDIHSVLIPGKGPKHPTRRGAGFEGKHFIEQAWMDFFNYYEGRYQRVLEDAFTSI